jgi:hypothetical protein
MSSLGDDFDLTKPTSNPLGKQLCQPSTICGWNSANNKCQCNITNKSNYLYNACHEKNSAGDDAICSWSTKDIDCPAEGCPALQVTFPKGFTPDDAADHHRPMPSLFAMDDQKNWDVPFNEEQDLIAGQQCTYTSSQPFTPSCSP